MGMQYRTQLLPCMQCACDANLSTESQQIRKSTKEAINLLGCSQPRLCVHSPDASSFAPPMDTYLLHQSPSRSRHHLWAAGLVAFGAVLLTAGFLLQSVGSTPQSLFQAPLRVLSSPPALAKQAVTFPVPPQYLGHAGAHPVRLDALPTRTGQREEGSDGTFKETFSFDIGAANGQLLTQSFTVPTGYALVPVCMPMPLGISFEGRMVGDKYEIFVEGLVEGGNAINTDVQEGDVLRATTAVFQATPSVSVP